MRDDTRVRTTLDIDDDVLQAVRELAENRRRTMGEVVSDLARQALAPSERRSVRNGVPLLARRRGGRPKPTMELVNRLRDEA
jgi:hypothetical protein